MPKNLTNFLVRHLQFGGYLLLAIFVLSGLAALSEPLKMDMDPYIGPWHRLFRSIFVLWFVWASASFAIGIRSGRLLLDR